jgi:hypothetical protein
MFLKNLNMNSEHCNSEFTPYKNDHIHRLNIYFILIFIFIIFTKQVIIDEKKYHLGQLASYVSKELF